MTPPLGEKLPPLRHSAEPIGYLREDFGRAFGAALQAIWCYKREHGQDISITAVAKDSVRPTARAVEPESGRFETYEILQARFNSLWKSLEKEFREHRKIQETEHH